eukprot:CAMPEP_0116072242 /NCGR_PEP_ID=MMETSP0322-20121206/14364_1 /TAXON_ID=163516 /ORGANISM="Leptocylindrus danicus var. apora, Strain B651" /LENGTH=519 /DNA_ID=CAMNT_0003560955 /DNA_START=358 /DNA_END=1917 /DNA_ORIENTATION=-
MSRPSRRGSATNFPTLTEERSSNNTSNIINQNGSASYNHNGMPNRVNSGRGNSGNATFDRQFGGYEPGNMTGNAAKEVEGMADVPTYQPVNHNGQPQNKDPLADIDTDGINIALTDSVGGETSFTQSQATQSYAMNGTGSNAYNGVQNSLSLLSSPSSIGLGSPASTSPNFHRVQTVGGYSNALTFGGRSNGDNFSVVQNLPPGGHYYEATIFTPALGVMFFKPKELYDSLYLLTEKSVLDSLENRPVAAYIVEGSSARSAGIELGHVLTKVNGVDVKSISEASRLIRESPRPLPLLFYQLDTTVYVAEGEHMVQYNSKMLTPPKAMKDWKPKYVVVGGIIAQSYMMNMYRSKVRSLQIFAVLQVHVFTFHIHSQVEYDSAVIDTQTHRPVSVKVKQFDLRGARINLDWQGTQMIKYRNKLHPTRFFVIIPAEGKPIKISSPNTTQLRPVYEGVQRVIASQQGRSQYRSPQSRMPVSSSKSRKVGSNTSSQMSDPQSTTRYQPTPHVDANNAGRGFEEF